MKGKHRLKYRIMIGKPCLKIKAPVVSLYFGQKGRHQLGPAIGWSILLEITIRFDQGDPGRDVFLDDGADSMAGKQKREISSLNGITKLIIPPGRG